MNTMGFYWVFISSLCISALSVGNVKSNPLEYSRYLFVFTIFGILPIQGFSRSLFNLRGFWVFWATYSGGKRYRFRS